MLLVFWLSTNVWLDTYTQRADAAQLQKSTLPEETLFKLARNIAFERSLASNLLIGVNKDTVKDDFFYGVADKSNQLKEAAIEQILSSRNTESRVVQHRYSHEEIDKFIVDLNEGFSRISRITSVVALQLNRAHARRNDEVRLRVFDAYSNLIHDINKLRLRIHYLPSKNYQHVVSTHGLKNSVWDISESTSQISSLLDSYLLKETNGSLTKLNRENLVFRIYQQSKIADDSLFEINEYAASNNARRQLNNSLENLTLAYEEGYLSKSKDIVNAVSTEENSAITRREWELIANSFRIVLHKFSDDTIAETLGSVRKIEKAAIAGLGLDTLLVLLCIGMAILSTRIAKKTQYQATHDVLTKLPNRRYFSSYLEESIDKSGVDKVPVYLMTVDLDGFKTINDTLGHAIGDALLVRVGNRLKACASHGEFIARMGGDEFSIIFITHDHDSAIALAKKVQGRIVNTYLIDGTAVKVGASIGMSSYPKDASNAAELQVSSDFAMFYAKKDKKDKFQLYNREIAQLFESRACMEKDLTHATRRGQFELHYQPQFHLGQNRVSGVEALIRWNHPQRGFVSPFEFIDVAEDSGLMPEIGGWVLNEACRQASIWGRETDMNIRIAINVSVHQLMQPSFVQDVFYAVEKHNITPDHIELEVTENVFMADMKQVTQTLLALKERGYKIAMDDFGTGYSSLSVLQDLPLDVVKIDRSFISKLDGNSGVSDSVTATIAKMADVMGLETVAEGVENEAQLGVVADLGITVIQGYYYSKPVPSAVLPETVASINASVAEQFLKVA